jgi:hypothetical protein
MEPLTARIDMVVDVDEAAPKEIARRTGLQLEPGVYLVDHKTRGQLNSNMAMGYTMSLQNHIYQMLYKACYDLEPKGMIFNIIVRHKKLVDNSFHAVLAPWPTGPQQEAAAQMLRNAKLLAGTDMANWAACNQFGTCRHYTEGRCDRS